jgi:uncharacterized membrane protein
MWQWIVAVLIYLLVDIIYVLSFRTTYGNAVQRVQKQTMRANVYAGIVSYFIMGLVWLLLVVPWMYYVYEKKRWSKWGVGAAAGALYGLLMYGVFNMTNMAMFTEWTGAIVAQDLTWGILWPTLFTMIAAGIILSPKQFDKNFSFLNVLNK